METLAVGGRYDALLTSYHNPLLVRVKTDSAAPESTTTTTTTTTPAAVVGAVLYSDKIVAVVKEDDVARHQFTAADVAVCTPAAATAAARPASVTKELALLLRQLWNRRVRASPVDHLQVKKKKKKKRHLAFSSETTARLAPSGGQS